jgi:hypothetical protein
MYCETRQTARRGKVGAEGGTAVRKRARVRHQERYQAPTASYKAVFEVLMSDYSVQEVLHPQEANPGRARSRSSLNWMTRRANDGCRSISSHRN